MSDTSVALELIGAAIVPGLMLLALLNSVDLRLAGPIQWCVGRPWGAVFLAAGMGALCAWPAYHIEKLMVDKPWEIANLGTLLLFTMLVAGAVEEGCKFAAFSLGPGLLTRFSEEYDGILFAGAVSLGFATVENLMYVRETMAMDLARCRAFTAVPAHAMFGVIMGARLGQARVRSRFHWSDMGLPLSGLLAAIVAHGLWDWLAFQPTPLAHFGLFAFLAAMAVYCVYLCWQARRRSPAFGGSAPNVPPPHGSLRLPAMPVPRNPWVAGVLGLVPGLGQAYNGELAKSAIFLLIGAVNLVLFWIAHLFVHSPAAAIAMLQHVGLAIVVQPNDLAQAVQQKWLLEPALLYLVLMWEVAGAIDAYATARRRWDRPQTHAVRRSFASHGFGASYVLHLLLVFMLILTPVVEFAMGQVPAESETERLDDGALSGSPEKPHDKQAEDNFRLTWVTAPITIHGWQNRAAAQSPHDIRDQAGGATFEPLTSPRGTEAVPRVQTTESVQERMRGSYDQYLSYQVRRHHNDLQYFSHVRRNSWAIVHYRITHAGSVLAPEVISYCGTPEEAERAATVIRDMDPCLPLPGDAREIDIIELFWSLDNHALPPGSLAERLSHLPDGRFIREIR